MGRPKGSKNKVKRVKVQIPCKICGSMEPYKFRFRSQLCGECYNRWWWQTYAGKYAECREQARDKYNSENKELIKKRDQERYVRDKEKILARKRERKDILNAQHKERYETDIQFRLRNVLRKRLKHALKKNTKTGSAVRDLGCSIEEFKNYLESKFTSGMTWENIGKWHIDHIKPLILFDLTDIEQLKHACHYTNLQPLWAEEHMRKGITYG